MRSMIGIAFAALLSAAAAPVSGPDALPGQVAGVVGSGQALALELKPAGGAAARTVKIGEVFEDGWVLSALTPSTATLTKAGASRTVGLNPSGALAAPIASGTPSQVQVAGLPSEVLAILAMSDQEVLAQAATRGMPYTTPPPGLTAEETRRLNVYRLKMGMALPALAAAAQKQVDAALAQGIKADLAPLGSLADATRLFGQDYADLLQKTADATYAQQQAAYQAALAGPEVIWKTASDADMGGPIGGGAPSSAYKLVAESAQGAVYLRVAPSPPDLAGSPVFRTPTLTAQQAAALPISAAQQAQLVSDNASTRATQQRTADAMQAQTYYSAFGQVSVF